MQIQGDGTNHPIFRVGGNTRSVEPMSINKTSETASDEDVSIFASLKQLLFKFIWLWLKAKAFLKSFLNLVRFLLNLILLILLIKFPQGESNKDTTLTTFDTENPYVRGYRFIVFDDSLTYLIFGLYNDTERVILPYIVIKCHTANPIEQSESIPVTYAILTGNQMMDWYIAMGASLHEVDDATVINNMPSDLIWNPINSNPNVRVVVDGNSTFILHPVKQENNWYVGYAIEQVVNIGQGNVVYRYHPNNNSPTIWNNDDSTIIADLRNTSKFNKKAWQILTE